MENKEQRIKELETENATLKKDLAKYINNPAAKFYAALTNAVDEITNEINNKTLDIRENPFIESIVSLAKDSQKIFQGLREGLAAFEEQEHKSKTVEDKKNKYSKGEKPL